MAFFRYGFTRASMEEIATAVGVSRQSLYNHFGNKRALFEAVVRFSFEDGTRRFRETLADTSRALPDRVVDAFCQVWGRHVPMMRTSPHAAELVQLVDTLAIDAKPEVYDDLLSTLTSTPGIEGWGAPGARTHDVAVALLAAARGLLDLAASERDYALTFRVVVDALAPAAAPVEGAAG